jgi:hypothetical protein
MAGVLQDPLFSRAAPTCSECGLPIRNTEIFFDRIIDDLFAISKATMVCPRNHRTVVYDAS